MPDKIFAVTGHKIACFITDENSLRFSSRRFYSVDGFQEAWDNKLSLATKVEIKYDSIKSITKEDSASEVLIKYKGWTGLPSDCEFSFTDRSDYEVFFNFLIKERYFTKTHENLSAFKAVKNYLIGLLVTVGLTIFFYFEALDIANGTARESTSGKSKLFGYLLGFLGGKGVIAVGVVIAGFIGYIIWKRFSNPPTRLNFLPPNA